MRLLRILLLLLLPLASFSQLVGKVVSIADGDTFTMLVNHKQMKIRLHGIDCPEKRQDFGMVAKQFLSDNIFEKIVTVNEMNTDRYKRIIGMVFIHGANINEKLLQAGLAWHYKTYDKNPAWARLENDARNSKRGLWLQPNAMAPWEFRKLARSI